jgi:hypothetical protein
MDSYFGETKCEAIVTTKKRARCGAFTHRCVNGGYFRTDDGTIRCGVHSKAGNRSQLAKNPNAKALQAAAARQREECSALQAVRNLETWTQQLPSLRKRYAGDVAFGKKQSRKAIEHRDGYQTILPNFRAGSALSNNGHGMKALSPMALGPVYHGQAISRDVQATTDAQRCDKSPDHLRVAIAKDQPMTQAHLNSMPLMAQNLENLFQGNKLYSAQADAAENPTDAFFVEQARSYAAVVPSRHHVCANSGKKRPICSLWLDHTGVLRRLSWVESREVYCTLYERHARKTKELATLRKRLEDGFDLQITGFDSPAEPMDMTAAGFEAAYQSTTHSFGHELVLAALLVLVPAEYPWRVHQHYMQLEKY